MKFIRNKEKIRNLFFKKQFTFDFVPGINEVLRPWVVFVVAILIVSWAIYIKH